MSVCFEDGGCGWSFVGLIIYDILYKVPVLGLYFYTKMIKYWGTINIFDQTNINFIISPTQVNKKNYREHSLFHKVINIKLIMFYWTGLWIQVVAPGFYLFIFLIIL